VIAYETKRTNGGKRRLETILAINGIALGIIAHTLAVARRPAVHGPATHGYTRVTRH
jgi:hypothetical protein